MTTTRPPASPPAGERPGRAVSGRVFVVACVLAAVAFVTFLVIVSPRLLEWTLSSAPPPAPHEVASGELAGQTWTATAVEQGSDQPCLEILAGSAAGLLCTEPRGPSLRGAQAFPLGDARLLYGIVDARTALVRLTFAQRDGLDVEPAYVDFGFPLGFFVAPLPAGADLTGVEALDSRGDLRGRAGCTGSAAGPVCRVAPLDE